MSGFRHGMSVSFFGGAGGDGERDDEESMKIEKRKLHVLSWKCYALYANVYV